MLAGLAKADITPSSTVNLTGYLARMGPSEGVHDPIFTRALVLGDGQQQAALIECDTLGFGLEYTRQAKQAIAAATGIPAANIMLAATHTHSAPASVFLQDCGDLELDWLASLPDRMAQAVRAAQANMAEVQASAGSITVPGIALNRRDPAGPVDHELRLVTLNRPTGEPHALLLSYACHAVVLTPENRLISADYPGVACARAEALAGAPAMFLQAPCGDINPTNHGAGFPGVAWAGEQLAQAAASLISAGRTEPVPASGLDVIHCTITLPLAPLPSYESLVAIRDEQAAVAQAAQAQARLVEAKAARAMAAWAQRILSLYCTGIVCDEVHAEVQAIRIGDLALIGVPGELFVQFGIDAAKRARELGKQAIVVAYCDGDIGYIPTAPSYEKGGYEVTSAYRYYGYPAPVSPKAAEIVASAIEQCLR